jgi:hypothetical protein
MEINYPAFPIYIMLPVCGAGFLLVVIQVWRLWDVYAAFLLLAMWLRYTLGAYHSYTFTPFVFGLSIVAFSSIFIVAAGMILIGPRNLMLRKLAPVYVIILIIVISAAYNQTWLGAINVTLKWLYLVAFTVAAYAAIERNGLDRVFPLLSGGFCRAHRAAMALCCIAYGRAQ